MTQAGGPAALNGFLYQILHHIGWIADIKLTGTISDHAIVEDACLTLEPRDGGDARAEIGATYIVEQYKARPDRTWSVNAIINDVLPDLRKAVPELSDQDAHYRFVTDGRPGKLVTFETFLAGVRSASSPDELDDKETYNFGEGLPSTQRALFTYIVETTRRKFEPTRANERMTVFHLLTRFEMAFELKADSFVPKIDDLLRLYAPDLGREAETRQRLIGILIERLSKGELRLDAVGQDELFRQAGLNPDRLRNLARLSETMAALSQNRLNRYAYQAEADVRNAPDWPADKSVLLITGDSGDGKTWQLYRLVTTLTDARQIVTVLPAVKDVQAILAGASNDIWQTGCGETNEKTLGALTQHYQVMNSHAAMPWLTIAVDDVQDVDAARDLIRQHWSQWGIRLALTVPAAVARSLQRDDDNTVHVHWVDRFSVNELDTLLGRKGRSWADLPSDLKKLLRTPILAGLYAKLPYESVRSAPQSEYEIFERFWTRIQKRANVGDDGILLALAEHVLDGKEYPLSRTAWAEVGMFDTGPVSRLLAAGWLQCTDGGDITFAHDRLLNWAVAKSLVRKAESAQFSVDDMAATLVKCAGTFTRQYARHLGYVPMDVLWLLTGQTSKSAAIAGRVVERLEASGDYGSYGEELYAELLPTIGVRAIPVLLERFYTITSEKGGDHRAGLIARGFVALSRQENVDLTNTIEGLLNSPLPDQQAAAITILTAAPDPQFLDRLWQLHQERYCVFDGSRDTRTIRDYEATFAALHSCTQLDSEWLRRRIFDADPDQEPISELTYLLKNLDHTHAMAIWAEASDVLMTKVQSNKPRSLLYCIGRFKDRSRLDFVLSCLQRDEDFAKGAALAVLVVLAPDLAIDRLADIEESERAMTRNYWLPMLLHVWPERTQQRLLELATREPKGRRFIDLLFSDRADDVGPTMLQFYLRTLEVELRDSLDGTPAGGLDWLFHPLRFLEGITCPDLLGILAMEAGSDLERMICEVACGRVAGISGMRDHILESARRVLISIGGSHITTLINRELVDENFWGRHGGLLWAMIRPDAITLEHLATIARRPIFLDANGGPNSENLQDNYQATSVLAAVNADSALVDAIWDNGSAYVSSELVNLRDMESPMQKKLTKRAVQVLISDDPVDDPEMRCALTIAWLSGDSDLITPVRAILGRAEPGGKVAALACIALQQLGDRSAEFAELAVRLVATEQNNRWGINALLSTGDTGFEKLAKSLRNKPVSTWQDEDEQLIRILHNHPSTRIFAVEAAVRSCDGQRPLSPMYDIAAEAENTHIRDKIFDAAFAAHSINTAIPIDAIEGLAKFDVSRAIEAADNGLRQRSALERDLCMLLARLAPDTAAEKLVNAAMSVDRKSLRPAIGHALRRLDPTMVDALLAKQMEDTRPGIRAVAIELAGWLPPDRLKNVLDEVVTSEVEDTVRQAALAALARQRREANVRVLYAMFKPASPSRRWALLLAIVDAGDPHLLTDREDPLWLGHILTDAPYVFAHRVKDMLVDRKQKEK